MSHRNMPVDPTCIERVALMTIEGEQDDITGLGQCEAAHTLCSGIPDENRVHFVCPHVGHYGIFNGSRFRSQIAPRIAAFVRQHDPRSVVLPQRASATASSATNRRARQASSSSLLSHLPVVMSASHTAIVRRARARGATASGSLPRRWHYRHTLHRCRCGALRAAFFLTGCHVSLAVSSTRPLRRPSRSVIARCRK